MNINQLIYNTDLLDFCKIQDYINIKLLCNSENIRLNNLIKKYYTVYLLNNNVLKFLISFKTSFINLNLNKNKFLNIYYKKKLCENIFNKFNYNHYYINYIKKTTKIYKKIYILKDCILNRFGPIKTNKIILLCKIIQKNKFEKHILNYENVRMNLTYNIPEKYIILINKNLTLKSLIN